MWELPVQQCAQFFIRAHFCENTCEIRSLLGKNTGVIRVKIQHCPQMGPYRDLFWHFGSLFIFQGPYFQCFGLIHAKNVNLFCMYTTISNLDLTVMSNDLHCYYMYIYVVKWCFVFIINPTWGGGGPKAPPWQVLNANNFFGKKSFGFCSGAT